MATDPRPHGARGLLDRVSLLNALAALSQRLRERGQRAAIHIAGGACMILAHQRPRATVDIDAIFIDERESVLDAAREVAAEQGLAADWLNDDIRDLYFQAAMLPDAAKPAPVLYDSPNLMVTGASPVHMLAMKAQACRDSDLADIALLVRQSNVRSMDEIRAIHESVFPYESLSTQKQRRLESILQQVLADGMIGQRVPGPRLRQRRHGRGHELEP